MKIEKVSEFEQQNREKYGMDFSLVNELFKDKEARQLPVDNPNEPRRKFYILKGTVKSDPEPLLCYFYRKRNNVAEIRTLCHWKESEYLHQDFSNAEKNPYISNANELISLRLPPEIIHYFQTEAPKGGRDALIRNFIIEAFAEYKKKHAHKNEQSI